MHEIGAGLENGQERRKPGEKRKNYLGFVRMTAPCPRCDGSRRIRMPQATVTTPGYGTNVTTYNLLVPCPVCRAECHEEEEKPCPKPCSPEMRWSTPRSSG